MTHSQVWPFELSVSSSAWLVKVNIYCLQPEYSQNLNIAVFFRKNLLCSVLFETNKYSRVPIIHDNWE